MYVDSVWIFCFLFSNSSSSFQFVRIGFLCARACVVQPFALFRYLTTAECPQWIEPIRCRCLVNLMNEHVCRFHSFFLSFSVPPAIRRSCLVGTGSSGKVQQTYALYAYHHLRALYVLGIFFFFCRSEYLGSNGNSCIKFGTKSMPRLFILYIRDDHFSFFSSYYSAIPIWNFAHHNDDTVRGTCLHRLRFSMNNIRKNEISK